MTARARLTAIEREHFIEIAEASLRVAGRAQFFAWVQGIVQALVPHEILVISAGDAEGPGRGFTYLTSTLAFGEAQFQAACIRPAGVLARLVAEWKARGEPLVVARGFALDGRQETLDELEAAGLGNVALHGVLGRDGRVLGCYAFARLPDYAVSARLGYLVQVILPYVHSTGVRVLGGGLRGNGEGHRARAAQITPREAEILGWIKEGKTNCEIAGILRLSPWTVKNHVQTILKKLEAQTRSHAVARAMSMGLLETATSNGWP